MSESRVDALIRQFLELEGCYLEWADRDGRFAARWREGRRFGTRPRFRAKQADAMARDLERMMMLMHRLLHATGHSQFEPPRNDYEAYMQSEEWDRRRRSILSRAKYRCEICGASKVRLTVAHLTYERLGHEDEDDLLAVCDPCHLGIDGIVDADTAGMMVPR